MEASRTLSGGRYNESLDTVDFELKKSATDKKGVSVSRSPGKNTPCLAESRSALSLPSGGQTINFRSIDALDTGTTAQIFRVKKTARDEHTIVLKLGDPKCSLNTDNLVWVESKIEDKLCPCKNTTIHDEAFIHQQLKHENIIQFLGFGHVDTKDKKNIDKKTPAILMEMADVSLFNKLVTFVFYKQPEFDPRSSLFLFADRLTILTDVAKGLQYMHHHSFMHIDLHPKNILISKGRAKLCDFGISEQDKGTGHQGFKWASGMAYMGPELFFAPQLVSPKIDVFSMGVAINMCIAGTARSYSWWTDMNLLKSEKMYDPLYLPAPSKLAKIFNTFDALAAEEIVALSNDPEYTGSFSKRQIAVCILDNIAKPCLQLSPHQRPDIGQVLSLLEEKKVQLAAHYSGSKPFMRPTPRTN